MADLSTYYLGMNLKSPLIVGSCGLTASLENIKLMEKNGAGAIVLKSIFEEEILLTLDKKKKDASENRLLYYDYSETYDYLDIHSRNEELENYLGFIREIKKEVLIPVIASINCVTDTEWTDFAMKIQEAGADALELNLFFNPTGFKIMDVEKKSVQIVKKILKTVSIPVSVKLSSNYSNLGNTIQEISETGVQGIVLFNRFFSVDFDLDKLSVISSDIYSSPGDFTKPLRWIALIADKIGCNIAASGGVHSGKTALKQILAGADAIQAVSILYKNGIDHLSVLLNEMDAWLEEKGFNSVSQVKGMMGNKNIKNPEIFERMQFMRYYGKLFD
jgi:dihydroorotate dehydrogenase (fumarate)